VFTLRTKGKVAACVAGVTALAVSAIGLPSEAATMATGSAAVKQAPGHQSPVISGSSRREQPGYFDARQLGVRAAARSQREQISARSHRVNAYQKSQGAQAVIDIDPLTKTVRNLGRLDGYLTAPAKGSARSIAMKFVRSHRAEVGLAAADLSTFRLHTNYVDPLGIHNLSWTQVVDGIPVFGNGLKVKVTRNGRVLSVQGEPVAHLAKLASAASQSSSLSASDARREAASDVGGKADRSATVTRSNGSARWSNNDYAKRVWFLTPSGLRLGWSTYVQAGGELSYQHVVDASSGRVLFRRSTVDNDHGDAFVYDYYPGAAVGGKPKTVNLINRGWLGKSRKFLNGTTVVAWSDVNDDDVVNPSEKTPVPGNRNGATLALHKFWKGASSLCSRTFQCTWNPHKSGSWRTNRKADVTQAFYLASRYHDYLAKPPISFTPRAGNFSASGGDPVLLNALDGANGPGGMPDGNHIDNANMSTPPNGVPPTMQMYLWHFPGATDADEPILPTSSAFDASVELHEYTHGLSGRLVVDATGTSTLNSIQANSMGEAWSDYYALDYLVTHGFVKDTRKSGQVFEGKYLTAGKLPFRTEAIDCGVGATAKGCTDIFGGKGGYTYGDFPTIGGFPEVHSSGEVWAQTLWDIRKTFGHTVADTLITRAMSLSADDPSMLDMRNAVIQADLVGYGSRHTPRLWQIFAHRGMGWYAGATSGADVFPAQDFHVRPAAQAPRADISGAVTNPITGKPVPGAVVRVAGQSDLYSAVTSATGHYTIANVFPGTYKKVVATAPGYEVVNHAVNTSSPTQGNFSIRRDWAAAAGGATIPEFNGPDFSSAACGPQGAIDLSLGSGWGSTTGDDVGTPTNVFQPKHIIVDMQAPIDITAFGVDPAATCGDPGSASTGHYRIETSPNGTTWTVAHTGTFTPADRGRINEVAPTAGANGVQFVRFTILGNQVPNFATDCPDGPFAGCQFTDLTELEVFGTTSP
jgi:extracellular elastinolytic metalloproteinase